MKTKKTKGLLLCLAGLFFILNSCRSVGSSITLQQGQQQICQEISGPTGDLTAEGRDDRWQLPARWDNRQVGRTTSIKNQGDLGTCWAFANLGALEALWRPQQVESFSVDHMVMHHGYDLGADEGGDFTMALAYLAAWKGPVWESEDPYDDGQTNDKAVACGHMQEAQLLKNDRYAIKEAILKNGAVQSSLYIDDALLYVNQSTEYYQAENHAYYYDGKPQYNHDVLIVGWDDAYSRENFAKEPEGDGAFLCQNSWGEAFGDQGFFYVSYYDRAIAQNTLTYSRLDPVGTYTDLYQYDELGWVGQMGYESETAWGANVFTARRSENLAAVSFYATDEFTQYEIYIDWDPNVQSFEGRQLAAEGGLRHAGYYTIDLEQEWPLKAGQRFAVIVQVTTPGSKMPLAAEYPEPESYAGAAQTEPGQSYISHDGQIWSDVGADLSCDVCLKAFTR